MRTTLITALMAATLLPAAAQAQSYEELRHDRRQILHEQHELQRARRSRDPHAISQQTHAVHQAQQAYREDARNRNWRHDDWRGYRDSNRSLYARGNWNAPFRYNAFRPGIRISSGYYTPRYFIADPWRYHLPPTSGYQSWVRHYDDVLLVDTRRGIVVDVIRGFFR